MDALLRVYAKCISGQEAEAKRRILEATQPADTEGAQREDGRDEHPVHAPHERVA